MNFQKLNTIKYLIIFLFLILNNCNKNQSPVIVHAEKEAMGTIFSISIYTNKVEDAKKAINKAFEEIKEFEQQCTEYKLDSYLSKINQNAGKNSVKVPDFLWKTIKKSIEIGHITEGAFDPTWAVLKKFWSPIWSNKIQSKLNINLPDEIQIKEALKSIGFDKIVLNEAEHSVFLPLQTMKIGLGGIVPGAAVDRVSELIKNFGFKNFIVNGGGEIYVSGSKGSKNWVVGIKHPRDSTKLFAQLPLKSGLAIVTSGDYERYIMYKGKRYSHLIDPRTGFPISSEVISTTIIASDAATADGLSTGLMILGIKKGIELAEKLPLVEVIYIDNQFKLHYSDGIKNFKIKLIDQNQE